MKDTQTLFIAVRLQRSADARYGLSRHNTELLDSNIEKRNAALKNMISFWIDHGVEYQVDGCSLFWLEVEGPHSAEYFLHHNEVEFAFSAQWYKEQESGIRGRAGVAYYDACASIASAIPLKTQDRSINYSVKDARSKAA